MKDKRRSKLADVNVLLSILWNMVLTEEHGEEFFLEEIEKILQNQAFDLKALYELERWGAIRQVKDAVFILNPKYDYIDIYNIWAKENGIVTEIDIIEGMKSFTALHKAQIEALIKSGSKTMRLDYQIYYELLFCKLVFSKFPISREEIYIKFHGEKKIDIHEALKSLEENEMIKVKSNQVEAVENGWGGKNEGLDTFGKYSIIRPFVVNSQ